MICIILKQDIIFKKAKIYEEFLSKIEGIQPAYVGKNTRQTFQSYTCYVEKAGFRDKIRKTIQNILQN